MIEKYFEDVFNTTKIGDAREESYYPDLKGLLESYSEKQNKIFLITALPKKTEGGNPDFRVLTAKKELVGYIEVKAPTIEDLDNIEDSEQLKRYRSTFPNLILTNLFEFRLYRNGELLKRISIGRPFVIHQLQQVPPVENQEDFLKLLDQFFSFSIPTTTTAKSLAIELAKRTRFLRDNVIAEELKEEAIEGTQTLEGFYKAFKDHLISSLEPNDFANLFAQTITYGLFAARSRAENEFNRELAYKYIPPTIGILKDVFRFISSTDLPQSMEWIIDDIAEVLRCSDVKKIMENFYKEGKGKDPIIHFYETFLAEYDPKEREKRGVYYTPEPVVSYITRSIHKLLKEKFNKNDGFADKSVIVLDPAAGTLTFPAYAINLAIEEFKGKYGEGGISSLIKDHILKDFYAFELMMAPYAIGHLKIGLILDNLAYRMSEEERFNLYLTNTLDFSKEDPNQFPGVFEQTIAKESQEALKVKEEVPVMVVMGNPPYSGSSDNKGEWILNQINKYKYVDGEPLGEKNPKWLQDDYVKFFRFAQWKIEKAGQGVVGLITNHAWLDNPTFRGMRNSLLKTFDQIFVLNLHGSLLKKEKTPDESKDENVFDIQTGVSITILIKKTNLLKSINYCDLWGTRENKYSWLESHDSKNTEWKTIESISPNYFLVPKGKTSEEYQGYWGVADIFPMNSVGIVTARDKFAIDIDKRTLEERVRTVLNSEDDNILETAFGLKNQMIHKMKKQIDLDNDFYKIVYRPFDDRWICYNSAVVERTREAVMKQMLKPNLGLMTIRQIFKDDPFAHVFVANQITDANSLHSPGIQVLFPLYIYESGQKTIFDGQEKIDLEGVQHSLRQNEERRPNIDEKIINDLENDFGTKASPEEIFYYIYAILYSSTYRQKYQEFLKTDYPRIPFTKDYILFKNMSDLGQKLVNLHLLKSSELENPIVKFKGDGDNRVDKVEFLAMRFEQKPPLVGGQVWINEKQYFDGVNEFLWSYFIGGYQVLDKWLKSRKGRTLTSEEVKTYCQIATAIHHTILIQKEIDKLYPEVEKSLTEK